MIKKTFPRLELQSNLIPTDQLSLIKGGDKTPRPKVARVIIVNKPI